MAINPVKFAEQYTTWLTTQQYKDTSPAAYAAELEAWFAVQQVEALKRLLASGAVGEDFANGFVEVLEAEYGDTWVETYLLPEVPDATWPESTSEVADDPDYTID